MPVQFEKKLGYILHPVDLAINKLLALAGRDEARDFLDVHFTHDSILPFGAQIWAACGKDPGFNPVSLLEILRRRGKYHPEDFSRLHLARPIDLKDLKKNWLSMLASAERFVQIAPVDDIGCLYFSKKQKKFFQPESFSKDSDRVTHFGKPGGIIPRILVDK